MFFQLFTGYKNFAQVFQFDFCWFHTHKRFSKGTTCLDPIVFQCSRKKTVDLRDVNLMTLFSLFYSGSFLVSIIQQL